MNLKAVFRNVRSSRSFVVVNLAAFAISIAAFSLIMLYVQYEMNFDKDIDKAKQMYRFTTDMFWEGGAVQETAVSPVASSHALVNDFPEIINATSFTGVPNLLFKYENESGDILSFYEDNVLFIDTNFTELFQASILAGDPVQIINQPKQLIVSESVSQKYFGEQNPLGKTIHVDNELWTVAGLMEDPKGNSHLKYNMLTSRKNIPGYDISNWRDLNAYTYILTTPDANRAEIESRFDAFIEKYMGEYVGLVDFRLQPMLDIHLKNDRLFDLSVTSNIKNVYFLFSIGIFIFLIALVNFVNISTIQFINRLKEIIIRKILGAKAKDIFRSSFYESLFSTMIAIFGSLVLVAVFFPTFKALINFESLYRFFLNLQWLLIVVLVFGGFAGSLPVIGVLKYTTATANDSNVFSLLRKNTPLRKALVTFQFTLTIVLLIGILVTISQMMYVKKKDLGFNKDFVVAIRMSNDPSFGQSELLKQELLKIPQVQQVGLANQIPGDDPFNEHFIPEGFEKHMPLKYVIAEPEYLKALDLQIIAGENLTGDFLKDSASCLINETALNRFGWSVNEAIGKRLSWNFANNWDDQIDGRVVGVVKDFHYKELHTPIEELVFLSHRKEYPVVLAKLGGYEAMNTIKLIESAYAELNPGVPINMTFLDEKIAQLYTKENQFKSILSIFNILAFIVSCIGLFGLVTYTVKSRTKEIGIRKANGAKTREIILMLNSGFLKWVMIAFILACPVAWYAMNKWLENFAYRINIQWWVFAVAGIITVTIALLTVSWQTIRAARMNPVESLRYE